ncbi:MAG: ABC transporter ATP-binding protein [Alloprevotella sp.]|nr:ABC transporter ATP-binding protein [Alloprevotella sp.]
MDRGFRARTVVNTLLGSFNVALGLTYVWATKWTIDVATGVSGYQSLRLPILCLVLLTLLRITAGIAARWISATLGIKAQNRMRQRLFERVIGSHWEGIREFHSGDMQSRLTSDLSTVITFLTSHVPSLFNTCIQLLGAFLFLYYMSPALAVSIVLILPLFLLGSRLYMRRMRHRTHLVRTIEARIVSMLQENLQHSLVVKTLQGPAAAVRKLAGVQEDLRRESIANTRITTFTSALTTFGFATAFLVTFIWGTVSLHRGLITYGTLIAFVQLVGQIEGPLERLIQFVSIFIATFTSADRLMELESIPAETATDAELRVQQPAGIAVRNAGFTYAGGGRRVFQGFSYDFPPGSSTAVTGPTGSGKTTLVRLLLAIINPTEGSVSITHKDGEAPISVATRCNFAYVPQGNSLLSGTIRENLLLACPTATDEQIREALTAAAAEFVFDLPQKLETPCGEQGGGLSEGQAQRIAIARALLKDAPFLLLDEATSALDAETEHRVLQNITSRCHDRTLIYVTHRPEALRYATQTLRLGHNG